jgi:hypothetical protein
VETILQIIGAIGATLAVILTAAGRFSSGVGQLYSGRAKYLKVRKETPLAPRASRQSSHKAQPRSAPDSQA